MKYEDEDNKVDLGTFVEINGCNFNIIYEGMQRHCFLCERVHDVSDCPTKARFRALKILREGKTEKRKIYSDSSLRSTNQLALTSNITCMSGGGIGQMCNALSFDKKYEEVVIYAGNNEVTKTGTLNEFVYTVEKTCEKLKKLVEETKLTFVMPSVPTFGASEIGKAQFLEEKIGEIKEIKTIKLEEIEYDGNHPSPKGTLDIIEQIQKGIGEDIILDGARDDVLTKRKYSQVQTMYKVGCRACEFPEYTPGLCPECMLKSEAIDTGHLEQIIQGLHEKLFPNFGEFPDSNEIDMKQLLKRGIEPTHDEIASVSKKAMK